MATCIATPPYLTHSIHQPKFTECQLFACLCAKLQKYTDVKEKQGSDPLGLL